MDALSSLYAAFAAAFTQDQRLFDLAFSDASLDGELLPLTLGVDEALSSSYLIRLETLCADAGLPLQRLIGLGVDIRLRGGVDGGRRLAGIVTAAEQLGADGGFARYALTVEPALAALKLRRNSRLFQERRVDQIVVILLDEQIAMNPVFARSFRYRNELSTALPTRSYCQQYRESDFEFIERLLREEGISYRFDFADSGDGGVAGLHTLVLFDAGSELPLAAQSAVRFHRAAAVEEDDTLNEWQSARQLCSGATMLSAFDYKAHLQQQGVARSAIEQGEAGNAAMQSLESYDAQAHYYASDSSELSGYALLRQQAQELWAKSFSAAGVVRGLAVGHWFTLLQHPVHDAGSEADRQFVVLRQKLFARNNFPDGLPQVLNSDRQVLVGDGSLAVARDIGIWNRIDAVRRHLPIVPLFARAHARPTARGPQSATVVGPAGEEVFTDALGRIRIQFHWPRAADHQLNTHGATADFDDHASCWVRVAYPSAGAGWGHQFIPRVGQEVLVDFIEGDIDRPLVIGALYNGRHPAPRFSAAGALPANRALSGIRSREHGRHRHNELLFDDTASQLRSRLASDHGASALNLGYLVHPRRDGSAEPRGEGFELRSDGAGAVRAAKGVLMTTEAHPGGEGGQRDRAELQTQLDSAATLVDQLGAVARAHHANQPESGSGGRVIEADSQPGGASNIGHLHHLRQATRNLERGSNTDPDSNSGEADRAGGEPLLLLHGSAGVALASPATIALVAGKNIDQISQRDTHQSTRRRWTQTVGESISLFVVGNAGKVKRVLKLIAAAGRVQLRAQSGSIEATASDCIELHALRGQQRWQAGKSILLECGGARVRIEGGDIDLHCPGDLVFRAASHQVIEPKG